ncbi:MAG: EamA family transporter [Acidimicrobiales bacterium]
MTRLLLLSFIWGWSYLFIKVAGEGMTPTAVAGIRVALAALVLAAVLHGRGDRLPAGRRQWRHFVVAAVFASVIPFTLLTWGEQRIASGLTAVLNAATPLFTAIFAAGYLRDRLKRGQVVGLVIGFVGVGVAGGFGTSDLARSSLLGGLASVGAGACYAVAFVYIRRHLTDIPPLSAATGQLIAASVILAPFALGTSVADGFDPTPTRVLSIVLLGAIGTGVAYVLSYRLIADLGATKASLVTYIIPIVAVVVGMIALGEPFTWRIVIGGLLIAAGVSAVHERVFSRRPKVPLAPTAAAVVLLAMASVIVGCTGDGDGPANAGGSACGAVRREALDPDSSQHVLPTAPEPTYLSDPPTSGPHQPNDISGALSEPLSRPVQVGALEAGRVLIQYDGGLDQATIDDLVVSGPSVVVAPNPDLREPIVATAWRHKLECSEASVDELRDFIDTHAGQQSGDH